MKTRLNKTLISDITERVIKDTTIPAEIRALEQELTERGTRLAREQTPAELLELSTKHPREWFHWMSQWYIRGGMGHSHPLASLHELPGCGRYHSYANISIEPVPWPTQSQVCAPVEQFEDLRERAEALAARYDQTVSELRAYLTSRRTVEDAVKDMPELAPFMPKNTVTTSGALVAASNVLSVLTASGFSVSAQQQKA